MNSKLGVLGPPARLPANLIRDSALLMLAGAALLAVRPDSAAAQGLPASALPASTTTAASARASDPQPQPSPAQTSNPAAAAVPDAAQQRGIIIVGGKAASSPSAPTQPAVGAPAGQLQRAQAPAQATGPPNSQQPLQRQLGQQPSQQQNSLSRTVSTPAFAQPPLTPQSAMPGAPSQQGNAIGPGRLGTTAAGRAGTPSRAAGRDIAAGRAARPARNAKQVRFLPQRTQIVNDETHLLEAQNALARATRIYNTGVDPTAPARTLLALHPTVAPKPIPDATWHKLATPQARSRTSHASPPPNFAAVATSAHYAVAAPNFARVKTDANFLKRPPGIWFVNNKDHDFLVTPNGYVTIQGKGFGDLAGHVKVHLADIDGNPQVGNFKIMDWHADEIYAQLPLVTWVNDQVATLEVDTQSGTAYQLGNGWFRAAREEYYVKADWFIQIQSSSDWPHSEMSHEGLVQRFDTGDSIDCKAPGTDYLHVAVPSYLHDMGIQISGIEASFGRTDSGDGDARGGPGDRVFTPGYSLGEWQRSTGSPFQTAQLLARGESPPTDLIPVTWGVWRTHSAGKTVFESPSDAVDNVSLFATTVASGLTLGLTDVSNPNIRKVGKDICVSEYEVALYVIAPVMDGDPALQWYWDGMVPPDSKGAIR